LLGHIARRLFLGQQPRDLFFGPLALGNIKACRMQQYHAAVLIANRVDREFRHSLRAVRPPVWQLLTEDNACGSLLGRRANLRLHLL
jgi:hypothetical protein